MKVICVDLDQTLVFQDTSLLLWLKLFFSTPWIAITAAYRFVIKGSAPAKAFMVQHNQLDINQLPYNQPLIEWLVAQKAAGHPIWLVTGTHQHIAQAVADHLGIFTGVIASDARKNLVSHEKGTTLKARFKDFIYIGDHKKDLNVWALASGSGLVAPAGRPKFNRTFDYHFHRPQATFDMWFALVDKKPLALAGIIGLIHACMPQTLSLKTSILMWLTGSLLSISSALIQHLHSMALGFNKSTLSAHHALMYLILSNALVCIGVFNLPAANTLAVIMMLGLIFGVKATAAYLLQPAGKKY